MDFIHLNISSDIILPAFSPIIDLNTLSKHACLNECKWVFFICTVYKAINLSWARSLLLWCILYTNLWASTGKARMNIHVSLASLSTWQNSLVLVLHRCNRSGKWLNETGREDVLVSGLDSVCARYTEVLEFTSQHTYPMLIQQTQQ